MTNAPFADISDFRDLDSINAYRELTEKGIFSREEMLGYLRYKSRDNARTPMQWEDSENAGFSTGKPWIMVNPNYHEINAKEQVGREDSVFSFYKKLVALRKERPIIVYGDYRLLEPESEELFIYERGLEKERLLVACNFTGKELAWELPEEMKGCRPELVIANYPDAQWADTLTLRAYEAVVWEWTLD